MTTLQSVYHGIFMAWYGSLPLPCYFCDGTVKDWGRGTWDGSIHHVDGDHSNNDPFNLAAAHVCCHTRFHTSGRKASAESNAKRSETLKRKTVCLNCGVEYNSAWMVRHVNVGKCADPTAEQLAEAARLSATNSAKARKQWADGKAGTYERTPEIRAKVSESLRGKRASTESNRKRSESLKRAYAEGRHSRPSGGN